MRISYRESVDPRKKKEAINAHDGKGTVITFISVSSLPPHLASPHLFSHSVFVIRHLPRPSPVATLSARLFISRQAISIPYLEVKFRHTFVALPTHIRCLLLKLPSLHCVLI
jgi:hypothetical protein